MPRRKRLPKARRQRTASYLFLSEFVMDEQTTTRLGTTIHAYAVTASLPRITAFRCYARFASVFAGGAVPVMADHRATRWKGSFAGPQHDEHVRDTMAMAAGACRAP